MYDVIKWTKIFIKEGKPDKNKSLQLDLKAEIQRFDLELKALDNLLTEKEIDINFSKKLLQGPLSDILTHIGQISMLSRIYGNPIEGEDFSSAKIKTGEFSYFENNFRD